MDNNSSDIIYHYCSTDTFMKIIENKTIRLSNIFKMNDPLEINYLLDDLDKKVLDFYKKNSYEFESLDLKDDIEISEEFLSTLISDIKEEIKELEYISYIACFSSSRKKDYLSQWRAYGNDGYGVALGFDNNVLHNIVKQVNEKNLNFIFGITKIGYSPNEKLNFIKDQLIRSIFRSLKNGARNQNYKNGNCSYKNIVLTDALHSISAILINAINYKNKDFKDEDEWRIYLTTFINGIYSESFCDFNEDIICGDYTFKNQRFRNDNNKLISYIDFCFGKTKIIKEIVIGPKSRIDKDDIDLRMFLRNNGFQVENIRLSEIKLNF
ncbi:DUF2971 domain-containing protein [Clostridium pasteurianum]|uniref:DUF2971 domain-containing protein n=1 Tax=Clostridium pasteurianum BC1 TaxID=86416 RepID=R4KDK7_CLOPA|nr:DUF2971 domain-containing protein [Clostridium pasteurianum]AGK97705.1 Protein of unknown function (DUF2971) [Clostridium pasteurianum BC1]